MTGTQENILLRVYLRGADRAPLTPTYERIVKAARTAGMKGATVLRGILGTGYHGELRASPWAIVQRLPVVVEIVDSAERIRGFVVETLDKMMVGGMLTMERAAVALRRDGDGGGSMGELAGWIAPLSTAPAVEGSHLRAQERGMLLRVFIGESDRAEGMALYEAIVKKVRELGVAGATVLRGIEGFGANSVVHKSQFLALSVDLPIVVEIVDSEEKLRGLLPWLDLVVKDGMVTMEHVEVLVYRHEAGDGARTE